MSYKRLVAYQKSFAVAMKIFHLTKKFPKEELYGLTGQIRRSSRGVCSNLVEGYRKRDYEAYFINKISDSDMENSETQLWLDFEIECGYITEQELKELYDATEEVGRLLNYMKDNPKKFLPKK